MKALILTGIQLSDKDKKLIQDCHIYKIALNHHAVDLYPTARYCSDYIVDDLKRIDDKLVFSNRDNKGILINTESTGSSLCDCAIWLSKNGFDVLIIGDNTVHDVEFQDRVKNCLKWYKNIYKFTEDGNFILPYISLEDFLK